MEITNSSLDLIAKQMSSSGKKEEKSVDGFSGFKSMLKDKNQKKEDGSTKDGNDSSAAASEAAGAVLTGSLSDTQLSAGLSQLDTSGSQKIQALESSAVTETGILEADIGATHNSLSQYGSADQFRLQQLTANKENEFVTENSTDTPAADISGTLKAQSAMELIAENTELKNDTESTDIGLQKKAPTQKETDDVFVKNSEKKTEAEETVNGVNPPLLMKSSTDTDEETEKEMSFMSGSGKVSEKQESEKEDKKTDDTLAVYQEKNYESHSDKIVQSQGDGTVYATVNAEDPDSLQAGISEAVIKQIDSGKKELEIQLEPLNLGKIRIKVSYEDDEVSVSVLCSESKTLKMLSQSAGDLGSILESNLERPIQIFVDKQEADYLNNQQESGGRQEQQQNHQQNESQESSEDFIQKLRLGILSTETTE